MPYRLRRRKVTPKDESEDTDEEKKEKKEINKRKQITPKSKKFLSIFGKSPRNVLVENDYDADAENDLKKVPLEFLHIKSESEESNEDEVTKRKNEFTNILATSLSTSPAVECKKDNVHCSIQSDNVGHSEICNNEKFQQFTIELSDIKTTMKPPSKISSTRKRKAINEFLNNPKNKENVTPPEAQSTPALMKLACRRLDDSLFGFNELDCTLPFSPVATDSTALVNRGFGQGSSISLNSERYSPTKRKMTDLDGTSLKDVPKEVPRKKSRRKKDLHFLNEDTDILEDLRSQFQEVEMHELAIE